MKFLNVSVTPQKNFKSGNYPVYNESNLICRNDIFNLPGSGAATSSLSVLGLPKPPPDEEYMDGTVCGVGQTINGQTGLNWYQETTYGVYENPLYWSSTYSTKNVWQRSGDTLIFNIYELPSGLLVNQQVFSVANLFKTGKFKSSCTSTDLARVDQVSKIVTFNQDVKFPPNEFGAASTAPIVTAGTYDLANAPGNYCEGVPPGCVVWRKNNWRFKMCKDTPCLIERDKLILGGCPEFWANTGAYFYPPDAWNLCTSQKSLIPACSQCG